MDTIQNCEFASAPINAGLEPADKIRLLREMIRIRRFEQAALKQYQSGKMGGFLHLYIGQESVAVGTCSLMGHDDHVITAYRDHGHALAVGMNMNECMAELFGKVTGCSKGKGGSMHFFAPDKNYWGGHGIVGGQTPLGLGLAYGVKYKGVKGSAMCFMGDGAVNQGCFYESLNMASLWNLPVIYIIENNGYSMGTSLARSSSFGNCLAERAAGFGIEWDTLNGEDVYEVRAKVQVAMERAHNESRPTVLEIATYRYYGHSVADAKHKIYRSEEEIERYKQLHDPIQVFKARLLEEHVLTEDQYAEIDAAAKQEADDSVRFAEESPIPSEASITEDVYFEVDRQTIAGRTGRHFFND
ncbi:MAG: pyruvate dehydrogenase (acetyl-transferring) E1 component subunit alpha [Verrucomicrobiota bacterium]